MSMTNKMFCILLCVLMSVPIFSSCDAPPQLPERTFQEYVSDESVVWLSEPDWENVPQLSQGEAAFSQYLLDKMDQHPDDTVFAIGVIYSHMIPENYMETFMYEGKPLLEIYNEAILLKDSNPEVYQDKMYIVSRTKAEHFNMVINEIRYNLKNFGLPLYEPSQTYRDNRLLFTFATKDMLAKFVCQPNVSVYFAGVPYLK